MNDERQWLEEFVARKSEDAFAAIVRLHVNMVFAVALRQTGDRGLAEEITQEVFTALSQKAPSLRANSTLAGWLYQTAMNLARMRLRSEFRRRRREEISIEINAIAHEGESTWSWIIPLLDEALLGLREADRLALILHYMEDRSFQEVGRALGVGEDAARKRVNRVLADLIGWFHKRGVSASAGALAAVLALEGQAAPATLASSILATTPFAAATATSGLSIFQLLMTSTQTKLITAGAVLLLLALTAPTLLEIARPRVSSSQPNAVPSPTNTASVALAPQAPANSAPPETPAAAKPRAKNFFELLNEGDESLARVSHEDVQAFLKRNSTNAESLVAAYQTTRDLDYLRRAATNFPNDPRAVLAAVAHNVFPEQRRPWLDQLKKIDPDNALASYLSAGERLKNKEFDEALREVNEAGKKTGYRDYITEQSQSLEELYLDSGHTPAEAKALGVSAIQMPHLHELVDLSRGLHQLSEQYQASGDAASSQAMIQLGLGISDRLKSFQEGGNMRLGEYIGWNLEKGFLDQLDPKQSYPFVSGSVQSHLDQFAARTEAMQNDNTVISQWLGSASDSDIISYYDRLKLYGESAALNWLKQRQAASK